MEPKKVVITGGTGLIGSVLKGMVAAAGYEVYLLSRKQRYNTHAILWDHHKGTIEKDKLKNTYAVIHLAGSGIADGRWTEARKKEIISSRVDTADLLFRTFKELGERPAVFVSSSGIGYYGADTGAKVLDETAPRSQDFISMVCQKWEQAALQFAQLQSRVVIMRTGIVLSAQGGALPRLSQSIKLGAGAPIASGTQYMSWIHMDDLCRLYLEALDHTAYEGVYNAVAQEPVTNKEFTQQVAKVLNKPLWAPNIPALVMKLLFGDMASLLIGGNNVSNQKLLKSGFKFKFPKLSSALEDLYRS
ncbi:MAG TPA: TIGR01777 family oxidoreductase [Cytophagales bacterium]|nr:TIGR01777 family oxidoreductase [Cytophagales bacterium]